MRCEFLAVTVLASVFVCGCDFFESKQQKVEILKLEQQKAEQAAIQKKDAATALKTYIEGKCQLVMEDFLVVSNALREVDGDIARLEKALTNEMGSSNSSNDSQIVATALANALLNQTVNEIARKYLSMGFASSCGIFVDRVKAAEAAERDYKTAIEKARTMYEKNVAVTGEWQKNTTANRDSEVYRLRQEIGNLEKKLQSERKKLQGNKTMEKEREANIDDYERQIVVKRRQVDQLLHPSSSSDLADQAVRAQLNVQERARADWAAELREIDRHFKPKTTVLEIVRESEKQTFEVLRKEIQNRRTVLVKRETSLNAQVRLAKEALLEVAVCDETELRQLRSRVDRSLASEQKR